MESSLISLVLLFPLLGAFSNTFLSRRLSVRQVGAIASGAVLISFVVGLMLFWHLLQLPEDAEVVPRALSQSVFTWISSQYLTIGFNLRFDPLSGMMVLLVTGVGFLIHVYSIGYMSHDSGYRRYFAFLNLFVFAMLSLVLGDNLVVMFLGWEGVGFCSYGLIGFWFKDLANARAGKKAFIVNRIGDFGFLIGMFVIFAYFNTLEFPVLQNLFSDVGGINLASYPNAGTITTLAVLLLFVGAAGKSAQIPLYVWLPDAMAGPTPVSALIHAATMVTAGVYMVSRLSFMKPLAESAFLVIAAVGIATAFVAATIAVAQRDIKKVLAYSTVSQLGYMFLACGVGASIAGMFHLVTHAFFKALLFLGSGSVIHAMHEEQNIFEMGGLRKAIPVTFWTFLIGVVAIAGVPPFSGFVSKDEILFATFESGNMTFYIIGLLTALLTAFYMGRLLFWTFFGEKRGKAAHLDHIHDSPPTMLFALVVLAVLSAIGGVLNWPHAFGGHAIVHHFLSQTVFENFLPVGAHGEGGHLAIGLAILSSAIGLIGLVLAYVWVLRMSQAQRSRFLERVSYPYQVILNKYYVDEIYRAAVVGPLRALSGMFYRLMDVAVIDATVNGSGRLIQSFGRTFSLVQSGVIQLYAAAILIGAGVLVILFMV